MIPEDLAQALAASIEAAIEERCQAIRVEAEKVIEAFRQQAKRLATGAQAPPPRPTVPPVHPRQREEPEPMERVAQVRMISG